MIEARLRLPRRGFTLHVELALPERGVSALYGPSGCGKTTVLRALAGLERAAGRVALGPLVWQDDATGHFVPTHRRELGYVIQEAALFPHLDVRRNLDYGLKRIPAGGRRIALEQVIELLGIGHLLARRPATLSGGERQRVAIARALAVSPRLLLMDEPLAALDAARKAEVLPYLERLHRELALSIVYVSHAVDEVARLADHVVLMQAGRVVGEGALGETLARLDLPLPLGEEAGVVLEAVVGARDAPWHLVRLDVGGVSGAQAPGGAGPFEGADAAAEGAALAQEPTERVASLTEEGRWSAEAARALPSPAPLRTGTGLWARDQGQPLGSAVRVRVLARDVSLARTAQTGTSIGNQWQGTVEALADDVHPALTLVRVRVGRVPLLARLSRRSAHALALEVGTPVWAQVKTVALMA